MHRPRLFQGFGRSKTPRPPSDQHKEDYEDFELDSRDANSSSWRRMLSRKPRPEHQREEEVVAYAPRPESHFGGPGVHSSSTRRRAGTGEFETSNPPFPHRGMSYDYEQASVSDSVPIVQREGTPSRMRDAFTGERSPRPIPMSDVPLPTGSNRFAVTDLDSPMEVGGGRRPRRPTVAVHNSMADPRQIDLEIERSPIMGERSRGKWADYRGPPSPQRIGESPYDEEYPPCVVVVERGRRGKPDTYYVIPGGAPVIFEDEQGRELTRVGDFSGRYRPQPQRPVIIQDEYGHEVHRMGFDDTSSSMTMSDEYRYRGRRNDRDMHHFEFERARSRSRGGSHYNPSRRYNMHDTEVDFDPRYPQYSNSRHGSPRIYELDDHHYPYERMDSRSSPSNVVYVDPITNGRPRGRGVGHPMSQSSFRYQHRDLSERRGSYPGNDPEVVHTGSATPADHHSPRSGPEPVPIGQPSS